EVAGQGHLRARALHRAHRGAEVARAVVEDDDRRSSAHWPSPSSVPLVDGTPVSRGSMAAASRNARANALNYASTRWWGSRPASTRTSNAFWAWKEIDSKTSRVREPW